MEEARIISSIDFEQLNDSLQEPIDDVKRLYSNQFMSPNKNIEDSLVDIFSFTRVGIFSSIFGTLRKYIAFSILFITFFLLKEKETCKSIYLSNYT